MSPRLKNKIAIVTGAGSGIGRACALALVGEGAYVVLVGRRKHRVEEVAAEAGGSVLALAADVSKNAEVEHVIERTLTAFGKVNVLVNNAGILHPGTAEQVTEDQWDETFNVNVRGLWLLSRAVLPQLFLVALSRQAISEENPSGGITDVQGIRVGHFTDSRRPTGCTVLIFEKGATAGVDVRGSAPGTRETDLLSPINTVQQVQAILLSGGSAFGLDAATGVVRFWK